MIVYGFRSLERPPSHRTAVAKTMEDAWPIWPASALAPNAPRKS